MQAMKLKGGRNKSLSPRQLQEQFEPAELYKEVSAYWFNTLKQRGDSQHDLLALWALYPWPKNSSLPSNMLHYV